MLMQAVATVTCVGSREVVRECAVRTGKAPEVVNPDLVVQLEAPAQPLHPPPESILLVSLRMHPKYKSPSNSCMDQSVDS